MSLERLCLAAEKLLHSRGRALSAQHSLKRQFSAVSSNSEFPKRGIDVALNDDSEGDHE